MTGEGHAVCVFNCLTHSPPFSEASVVEGSEVDGVVDGVVDGAVGVVAGSVEGAVDGVVGTVVGSVGSSTRATTLFTVLYRELATKSLEISTPVALSYLLLYV